MFARHRDHGRVSSLAFLFALTCVSASVGGCATVPASPLGAAATSDATIDTALDWQMANACVLEHYSRTD